MGLSGCAPLQPALIQPTNLPFFFDDETKESLRTAIEQQQTYLNGLDSDQRFYIAEKTFSAAQLSESIGTFADIIDLDPTPLELNRIIRENFTILQAGGRTRSSANEMLVTGYFEPILQGSLTRSPPFIYPLYAKPEDLVERLDKKGDTKVGRIDEGGLFRPYWTREEIEQNNTASGYELAYLQDPFDVFLLHVQGSGKIQLHDGTLKSIRYHTNNGHPYSSIGKLLVDEKKMTLEEVDIPAIRKYLLENPDEQQRIFNHNRRYIFFRWGDQQHIKGSIGVQLTSGRSVAIDKKTLPMGMIAYLVSQKPVVDESGAVVRWAPLQRFVVPQDTGSAIKGAGRVDLFWGNDDYAEAAAGTMKEQGYLYFLIKSTFEGAGEKSD